MRQNRRTLVFAIPCLLLVGLVIFTADADGLVAQDDLPPATIDADEESAATPDFRSVRLRGKVVWTAAALQSEFGISSVPESSQNSLAILTTDGRLIPIVENLRGRAFRKDERLREMQVELLARQHAKQPFIQILRVFQVDGEQKFEVDYWCDVCAIVMYEKGPCSCCQDDNRLRKRAVKPQP